MPSSSPLLQEEGENILRDFFFHHDVKGKRIRRLRLNLAEKKYGGE